MTGLFWKSLSFFLILTGLIGLVYLIDKVQYYFSKAQGVPAKITVESQTLIGQIPQSWRALAQGGEEANKNMLAPVREELKTLGPAYIRLDHIYDDDFYGVVSGSLGDLKLNWTKLDQAVNEILAVGAKPFFVLSYMPKVLNPERTGKPLDWQSWQLLVQKTIEHYSGKNGYNLSGVYYEVWNEPDLESFGGWRFKGEKNYLDLYLYAALGAKAAQNVNRFKIGGPATTAYYENWVRALIELVKTHDLPLDFISYHCYTLEPAVFAKDIDNLNLLLNQIYPERALIERIISEWGPSSEREVLYQKEISASHALTVLRELDHRLAWAFAFEIKDGPIGENGWGFIGHENKGKPLKPRYRLYQWLNQLGKERLKLEGEGSWVKAWATREGEKISVLLTNYDPKEQHVELTPVTFNQLEPGIYRLKIEPLMEEAFETTQVINATSFTKEIYLPPNSIVRFELTRQ